MRLRGLVDAHIAHAVDLCRAYRDVADRMVSLEVRAAQAERLAPPVSMALRAARAEMRDHAIAARAAADGALGAAAALAIYTRGFGSFAGERRRAASASAVRDRGGLKARLPRAKEWALCAVGLPHFH